MPTCAIASLIGLNGVVPRVRGATYFSVNCDMMAAADEDAAVSWSVSAKQENDLRNLGTRSRLRRSWLQEATFVVTHDDIVAIGLLTQDDIRRLGENFSRLFPVPRDGAFDDLIKAIDAAADRRPEPEPKG